VAKEEKKNLHGNTNYSGRVCGGLTAKIRDDCHFFDFFFYSQNRTTDSLKNILVGFSSTIK